MIALEKYLIDNGFIPFTYDCKNKKLVKGYRHLSTIMNLDNRYYKSDNPTINDKCIIVGLYEVGKPPRLIYPLPKCINEHEISLHEKVTRYLDECNLEELVKELIN